jgi:hypothetical protein
VRSKINSFLDGHIGPDTVSNFHTQQSCTSSISAKDMITRTAARSELAVGHLHQGVTVCVPSLAETRTETLRSSFTHALDLLTVRCRCFAAFDRCDCTWASNWRFVRCQVLALEDLVWGHHRKLNPLNIKDRSALNHRRACRMHSLSFFCSTT